MDLATQNLVGGFQPLPNILYISQPTPPPQQQQPQQQQDIHCFTSIGTLSLRCPTLLGLRRFQGRSSVRPGETERLICIDADLTRCGTKKMSGKNPSLEKSICINPHQTIKYSIAGNNHMHFYKTRRVQRASGGF